MQPSKSSLDRIEDARGLERKVSPEGSPPLQASLRLGSQPWWGAAAGCAGDEMLCCKCWREW
jgi:hypothetical protein